MPENTPVAIRDALPADQATIVAMTIAAYEQYAPIIGPIWEVYRQNIIETLSNPGDAVQLVAEHEGAIVGAVLLLPAGTYTDLPGLPSQLRTEPEVRLLAVLPSARGLGIGRALMLECINRTRAAGSAVLMLHTTDMMAAAMSLYEDLGFARALDLDSHPMPGVTVKGYRLAVR